MGIIGAEIISDPPNLLSQRKELDEEVRWASKTRRLLIDRVLGDAIRGPLSDY